MPIRLFASMGLTLCALCFHTFIFVVYLSKKKFRAFDSSIFLFMYVLTFIILIDECLYIYAMYAELEARIPFVSVEAFCYAYIYLNIIWFVGLIIYILSKIKTSQTFEQYKRERMLTLSFLSVISVVLFVIAGFLKVEYPVGKSHLFVFAGSAVYILYGIAAVALLLVSIGVFVRRRYITNYQKYPIYFCIATLIIVNGLQFIFDYDWNSLSFLLSFIMITLYFTIESQDLKLNHELEQKSEEAEIAYNTKTQFLANMSHEIRTPLNTILNISHAMLYEDIITEKQIQNEGKMIQIAGEELHQIINNILDISSAESNKLEKDDSRYNMSDLIYSVDKGVKDKLTDDKVILKIDTNSSLMQEYNGDYQKISKMLIYIISSFIKNTEYGIVTLKITGKTLSNSEQEISFDIISPANKITDKEFEALFNTFKNNNAYFEKNINNISLELMVAREYLDILQGDYQVVENDNGLHCSIHINQTFNENTPQENNLVNEV